MDYFSGAPLGSLVFDRTYSRTKQDGTKETWADVVQRVVLGNTALVAPEFLEPNEAAHLTDLMLRRVLLPAGRHLWVMGTGSPFNQNCWRAGWSTGLAGHCTFTFDMLMTGGGVGANYSSSYLKTLRPILGRIVVRFVCDPGHPDFASFEHLLDRSSLDDPHMTHFLKVDDSREGWVQCLNYLIRLAEQGSMTLVLDVSNVRPSGSPIRGFGGIAAGPEPLMRMLTDVAEVLYRNLGERINPISAMDIDHAIASCVVAGNVRRSARMSILHWKDPFIWAFLDAKRNSGSHWSTNISVEVDDSFFVALGNNDSHATKVLDAVIDGMLRDGEPGIFNSALAAVNETGDVRATNPCLTGDTVISTLDGPRTFKSLADEGADVLVHAWHPESKLPVVRMMRNPRLTGRSVPVLEVAFDSGLKIRCTPDHSFFSFRGTKVKAKDLKVGNSVRAWSMSSDSSGHLRVHAWDSQKNGAVHQWVARMVYENASGPVPEGFVVHHKDEDTENNAISNLELLTNYEHQSHHYPARAAAGFVGTCRNHKVVSIRNDEYADVYNGTVDDAHTYIVLDPVPVAGIQSGVVSANCGEIALQEWEPCCLGHVNLAYCSSPAEEAEAFRLMARFLVRATFSGAHDPKSQDIVAQNRRIGVGFLGLQEWMARDSQSMSNFDADHLSSRFHSWRAVVGQATEDYAAQMHINAPIKTTAVAPTGTVAKLAGVSEGCEPIYAKHYVRRVRYASNDPALVDLEARGVPLEPCVYAANTVVASFPCEDPSLERLGPFAVYMEEAKNIPIGKRLELQALIQTHYADNAVSNTINVEASSPAIRAELRSCLIDTLPQLKGTTVFPAASRPQSPIERITEDQYLMYTAPSASVLPGTIDIEEELSCASGACPIR